MKCNDSIGKGNKKTLFIQEFYTEKFKGRKELLFTVPPRFYIAVLQQAIFTGLTLAYFGNR
jgi:hypothetical protein